MNLSREIRNRTVGAIATLLVCVTTFLISSYFSSLATNARVDSLEYKIDKILMLLCYDNENRCRVIEKNQAR